MAVMNASALLQSQGWRGKGHSLHKTDDSIGLAKPLLLNRKDNTKGLGTTQHFTSDQWWMNAFDEQLKGLETSKEGKVTQTVKTGKLNAIEKGSLGKYSLYLSFVRGGFLQGTLKTSASDDDESESESCSGAENASDETPATSNPAGSQSKKDRKVARKGAKELKEDKEEDKEKYEAARRAENEEKRAKKEAKRRREEKQLSQPGERETREERKARKAKEKRSKEGKLKDKMERRKKKEERRAKNEASRREKQRPAFSC